MVSIPAWMMGVHLARTPSFASLAVLDLFAVAFLVASGAIEMAAKPDKYTLGDWAVGAVAYLGVGPFLASVIWLMGHNIGNPVMW